MLVYNSRTSVDLDLPSNKTPMLLDSAGKSDLLTDLGTGGAGELESGGIGLDGDDLGTGGGGTNVDHEDFVLCKLSNLGLLAVGGLDTEQTTEQEVVDLDLSVDGGELATETKDETDQTIGTAEGRVDTGTNTNETTGNGELQVVVLGEQSDNSGEDGLALNLALLVLADNTGSDLNLVTELQYTSQDTATSNTTLQVLNLSTRLVDIERSDNNHVGSSREVSWGNGDLGDEVLVDGVNVELQLGTDGDDGAAVGNSTTDELQDGLVMLTSGLLAHKIDLVLEDDDVVQLHDLNGGQMLRGLGLRAGFVSGNKEKGGVHDGGARQHGAHENVVTGAVDEATSLLDTASGSHVCYNSRNVSKQTVCTSTSFSLARRVDLLVTLVTPVAGGARALFVVALVNLCVRVTELDGNVSLQLVLETDSLYTRDGLDDGRLSVSDVTNGSDVDSGLAGDNFGRQRVQSLDVDGGRVGLLGDEGLLDSRCRCGLLQGRLGLLLRNIIFRLGLVLLGVQSGRGRR